MNRYDYMEDGRRYSGRRDRSMYDEEQYEPYYGERDYRRGGRRDYEGSQYESRDYRRGRDGHYGYDEPEMRGGYYYGYMGEMPFEMRGMEYEDGRRGRRRRDRGMQLSKREYEDWKRELENADGSRGAHFTDEQVRQAAKQMGINPEEFGECVLEMTVNMLYSDYCKVLKKYGLERVEPYIELAYAFLKDEDFHGSTEEKLSLYYRYIVEK